MKRFFLIVFLILGFLLYQGRSSRNAEPLYEPSVAIQLARESDKVLIISVGSEGCGRCKAVKKSVQSGEVTLLKQDFVWLDIDYYKEHMQWFRTRYRVDINSFPTFLAVSSTGKMLSQKADIQSIADLNNFLDSARQRSQKQ